MMKSPAMVKKEIFFHSPLILSHACLSFPWMKSNTPSKAQTINETCIIITSMIATVILIAVMATK
jgi:hypothetical protein